MSERDARVKKNQNGDYEVRDEQDRVRRTERNESDARLQAGYYVQTGKFAKN